MDNIIEINNFTFRYSNKFIFDNFSLSIKRGEWITIAGSNGSGKTTLTKALLGLEKSYSNIKILGKELNKKNIKKIRKEIGVAFDVPENYFACETVEDELAFSLENMGILPSVIKKKIKEITELFDLKSLLNCNPYDLSGGEKQIVQLASALMIEPQVLILDESLMMIDINMRKKIYEILKKYNNNKKLTIISFTHSLEETIYSSRLVVINNGKLVIDGKIPEVYEEELLMRKIGLEVPFEIELSKKLKLYNLIDKITIDKKGLVDKLWK